MKFDKNQKLKEAFVNYLKAVPSYEFASHSIGKDSDTTRAWRKKDKNFSAQCKSAIAEFVNKTLAKAKPEFALERLLRKQFGPKSPFVDDKGKSLGLVIIKDNGNIPK